MLKLSELETTALSATPGPWYVDEDPRPGMSWNRSIDTDHKHGHTVCMMTHSDGKNPERDRATADHIANCSPESILAMAAVVRAAKEVLESSKDSWWPSQRSMAALREALKGIE